MAVIRTEALGCVDIGVCLKKGVAVHLVVTNVVRELHVC